MSKNYSMRFTSILVALALIISLIPGASAASGSKSTPYGTMHADLSIGYDDQHGVLLVAHTQTNIDSSVTMRSITHKVEMQWQDTGATIMRNSHTYDNTNDTGLGYWEAQLDQSKLDRSVAVYSTHQVLYNGLRSGYRRFSTGDLRGEEIFRRIDFRIEHSYRLVHGFTRPADSADDLACILPIS